MSGKYLVIQLDADSNLAEIVESIREHADRIAILDEPIGTNCSDNESSQSTLNTNTTVSGEEFHSGEEEVVKKNASKRKKTKKSKKKDPGESARSLKRNGEKHTVICQCCSAKQTLRPSYGRRRLVDHALRHLSIPIAKCGDCGFQSAIKQQVRRHCFLKHKTNEPNVMDLPLPEDYNERVDATVAVCFPDEKTGVLNVIKVGDTIQVTVPIKDDTEYESMAEEQQDEVPVKIKREQARDEPDDSIADEQQDGDVPVVIKREHAEVEPAKTD